MSRIYTKDNNISTLSFIEDLPNGGVQCECPNCKHAIDILYTTENCPNCNADLVFPAWCDW